MALNRIVVSFSFTKSPNPSPNTLRNNLNHFRFQTAAKPKSKTSKMKDINKLHTGIELLFEESFRMLIDRSFFVVGNLKTNK